MGAESPKDECGLFGVWAPGEDVARLTYFGLFAQQHRGQESAGIAVSDGTNILVYKDLGLVSQVFNEATLTTLHGDLAIGHTRYSTTGSSTWDNAQPVFKTDGVRSIALGHNGNLVNTHDLAELAGTPGHGHHRHRRGHRDARRADGVERAGGRRAAAPADAWTGRSASCSWTSEASTRPVTHWASARCRSAACRTGSASPRRRVRSTSWARRYVRDVEPGELVRIDDRGSALGAVRRDPARRALHLRVRLPGPAGLAPAGQVRPRGPPRDGTPARRGGAGRGGPGHRRAADRALPPRRAIAEFSGIPYGDGLIKNHYVRPDVHPAVPVAQGSRRQAEAEPAHGFDPREAPGRSSTTRSCAAPPRGRSCRCSVRPAPPRCTSASRRRPSGGRASTASTCPRGRSSWRRDLAVDEINAFVGADSLAYLSLDGLVEAAGSPKSELLPGVLRRRVPGPDPGAGLEVRAGRAVSFRPRERAMSDAYRRAGVDPRPPPRRSTLIADLAARARRPEVVEEVGGFAGLFRLGEGPAARRRDRRRRHEARDRAADRAPGHGRHRPGRDVR